MGNLILQIILVISLVHNISPALAPSIRPCLRNSPNAADCVKQAIEQLRPQISTGVFGPNLQVDAMLKKLYIGDLSVNRNLDLKLLGLVVIGMDNFKIEKLRINTDNFKLEMIVSFPHIEGLAKYILKWNLGVALQGSGDNKITLDNVKAHIKLSGTRYVQNGIEFLKIDSTQVSIKAAQLRTYFDNLFNGQKALEQTANEVVNQNIDIIKGDVFPIVEQNLAKILQRISNQIFASAPYNDFFPLN